MINIHVILKRDTTPQHSFLAINQSVNIEISGELMCRVDTGFSFSIIKWNY